MIGYMKRQFIWAAHNKRMYIFLGICLAGCILANGALLLFQYFYGDREGATSANMIMYATQVLIIPYYLSFLIAGMVFRNGYKKGHIKADMEDGVTRTEIYFGRLYLELVLTIIFVVAIAATFWGCVYLIIGNDGTLDLIVFENFIQSVLAALPLWIAGVSISNMLCFVFKNKKFSILTYLVCIVLIPQLIFEWLIQFPFFQVIADFLITPQFYDLSSWFTRKPLKYWIMGILYTLLSSAAGYFIFKKKRI